MKRQQPQELNVDLRTILKLEPDEQLITMADNYNLDTSGLNRQQIEQLLYEAVVIRLNELKDFGVS